MLNKHKASRPLNVGTTGFPQGEPVFAVDQPSESVSSTYKEVSVYSGGVPVVLSVWTLKLEATTVVFYPGTMTSPRNYALFLELLVQQGFNVVGLHPLSHGHSPRIKKVFTFADILGNGQDAVRWTRQHFSGPVVLAGHSQGGILTLAHIAAPHAQQDGHSTEAGSTPDTHLDAAFALCTLLPEHPRAIELTIFSPLTRWREQILRGCTRLSQLIPGLPIFIPMYLSLRKILRGSHGSVRSAGMRASYPLAFIASLFNTNLAHATRPGAITCPLTLICAANDALFTPDLMQTMFDSIAAPDKEYISLDGGGHMAPLVPQYAAEIAGHMARICRARGFALEPARPLSRTHNSANKEFYSPLSTLNLCRENSMDYAGIILGLGNPSTQYEGTRHNMGFAVVDAMLEASARHGRVENLSGGKFKCELWRCTLPESSAWWLVAKPQTFMNLSGECAQPLMAWHRINPDQAIVIHDELDIKPGFLRFKYGGGNAGHNGLKSITQHLGTPDFHRLRVGIGRPPFAGDVTPWVLGRPTAEDMATYAILLPKALETIYVFSRKGGAAATLYANKVKPETISSDAKPKSV